jgi:hypothetical protein
MTRWILNGDGTATRDYETSQVWNRKGDYTVFKTADKYLVCQTVSEVGRGGTTTLFVNELFDMPVSRKDDRT